MTVGGLDNGTWDVVVVGAGPAGLAAATWAARYRRRVLVIDAGQPRNRWTEAAHGYLGHEGVEPGELVTIARRDLARYEEVELVETTHVHTARRLADGLFRLMLDSGRAVDAHRVILATGVRDVFPDVANFEAYFGRAIFTCPSCDGYEAQGRSVAVVGDTAEMAEFGIGLLDWARSVTVVVERSDLRSLDAEEARAHQVSECVGRVVGVSGDGGALTSLELADGSSIECDVAFWHMPVEQQSDLALQLGCALAADGYVAVDEHGATSVPHVFAAGDMTPGPQLIQVAAAAGARAGIAAAQSLHGHRGSSFSPTPAPDADALTKSERD